MTNYKVDVKEIIKGKSRTSLGWKLRLLIPLLKRVIHQDEVNIVIGRYQHLSGYEFAQGVLEYFKISTTIRGVENIPTQGQYLFVCNHPLGGFDGIVISSLLGEHFKGKIKVLVNDILLYLKPFSPIFLPVNKMGGQSKQLSDLVNSAYGSDNQIITFPAGKVSRKTKEGIKDDIWKKSFVVKAREHQRDIVPLYFEGKNSALFYWIANTRVKLGIKLNIEMILLADELFKARGRHFTLTIGKPIAWEQLTSDRSATQWAQQIKEITYTLK